jgi:hypothetical protein
VLSKNPDKDIFDSTGGGLHDDVIVLSFFHHLINRFLCLVARFLYQEYDDGNGMNENTSTETEIMMVTTTMKMTKTRWRLLV